MSEHRKPPMSEEEILKAGAAEFLSFNSDDPNALILHRLLHLEQGQTDIKNSLGTLSERVTQLEVSEKFTRWIIGGISLVGGLVLRELIPVIGKLLGV